MNFMKNFVLFILFISFFSCQKSSTNDSLPNLPVNETIFLNNPEFINLQTVGGWAYANGGIKGLIIYHENGSLYKAYDRACPHISPNNCSTMIVENSIKMICPCDDASFNILNGAPLTSGISFSAREYKVTLVSNSVLKITNF